MIDKANHAACRSGFKKRRETRGALKGIQGIHPFVVEKGTLVPFNQVLRHWSGAKGTFLQLFVANASRADEARLCLNVHGSAVKRLTCARYQYRRAGNWDSLWCVRVITWWMTVRQ